MAEMYSASIGSDAIACLVDPAGAIGCAGLLDHVLSAEDSPDRDTMVFDNAVARILRELPDHSDGHMSGGQIWIGGIGYPVTVS